MVLLSTWNPLCFFSELVRLPYGTETIEMMGDKVIAKALAKECGLPLVPGMETSTEDVEDALAFVEEFGMPVMLKANMGGGGRGMRVVKNKEV